MPEYCERSVFEALVNALIHRDYLVLGSEVHIDIYDDRLTIYSPGGMADGTLIQERDIYKISSTRRNPLLADIFERLGYMERQGSGFKKSQKPIISLTITVRSWSRSSILILSRFMLHCIT